MFPLSDPDLHRQRFPVVNICLIALCALVFVYELILGYTGRISFFYQFGLIPSELTQGTTSRIASATFLIFCSMWQQGLSLVGCR